MKRITTFGLALALVGCWVGGAAAALLEAKSALLVPYYEVGNNLATLIGVQHVGTPAVGQSSEIAVFVHDGDNGEIVETSSLCLAEDEFGAVVLQSARPTKQDTRREIYISVADDEIGSTGFVTLVYEGDTSDCGRAGNQASAAGDEREVMVAWAILQDVSNGFFAAEIPVTEVEWSFQVNAVAAQAERKPYPATCYLIADGIDAPGELNTNTSPPTCQNSVTHTFVRAGEAYCYLNTDNTRAAKRLQLTDDKRSCDDPYTHTFVPANTTLPAVKTVAAAPGADFAADSLGLALNGTEMGARFDLSRSNNSRSNIYVWMSTAPPTAPRNSRANDRKIRAQVVCEDSNPSNQSNPKDLTSSQINQIDINGWVSVINPSNLGCSGRGVLNVTLENRAPVEDYCYLSTDTTPTYAERAGHALDDPNNRCYTFARKRNADQASETMSDSYFCYNSTTATSTAAAVIGDAVAAAEVRNADRVVTGCSRYNYVPDVSADAPDGFIFSHITQMNDHFRINGAGYAK